MKCRQSTNIGTCERQALNHDIEQELTLRLERVSDFSERAKRANDAAQHEIDRARRIADELRDVVAVLGAPASCDRAAATSRISGPLAYEVGR